MGFTWVKKEREVRKFIEELGGVVISIFCNKHWKVRALFDNKQLTIVLSKSPSDYRALMNRKTEIRKRLNDK
jgi:hypothetical protein